MPPAPLDVCAAVIRRDDSVLIAQRPHGKHLAGRWEFPGGKVHEGESLQQCIEREIREELGLSIRADTLLATVEHTYPETTIRLHFLHCHARDHAEPRHHEGQDSRWVRLDSLPAVDWVPADRDFAVSLAQGTIEL